MGFCLARAEAERLFQKLLLKYDVFAPVRKVGEGCFSDTDVIRYDKICSLDEIVWESKSDYSFKEALLPINETLFYFTEDETTIPKDSPKGTLIFLRACDLCAVKRLDEMYLKNGFGDFYYARRRERTKFVLMGCETSCESGFCVSMGTNRAENYDLYLKADREHLYADCRDSELERFFRESEAAEA